MVEMSAGLLKCVLSDSLPLCGEGLLSIGTSRRGESFVMMDNIRV